MKKILIALLAIIAIFTLTACGSKDDDDEESSRDRTSQREKKKEKEREERIKEDEKKDYEEDRKKDREDDEIIDEEDDDNYNYQNRDEVVKVEEVINCEGCVYSYFSDKKELGSTLNESEYTTDITTLKTNGGKQRHNFFGFVLSGNKITRAYACVLKDNKIYCIEGTSDGSKYESNIGVLNQVFKSDECKYIANGNTYTCTNGSYNGDTRKDGYTSMLYETGCSIGGQWNNHVTMSCN